MISYIIGDRRPLLGYATTANLTVKFSREKVTGSRIPGPSHRKVPVISEAVADEFS